MLTGENLAEVGRLGRELQGKLAAEPGLGGRIDTDLQLDLPQLVFQPDRLRIASAGLSTSRRPAAASRGGRRSATPPW